MLNNTYYRISVIIILFILKNIIILFDCIVVYQYMPTNWINLDKEYGYINIKTIVFTLGVFILIYVVWILINIYILRKIDHTKELNLVEILFYIIIIALPIYLAHDYHGFLGTT